MFRTPAASSLTFFLFLLIIILMTSFVNGRNITQARRKQSTPSTRKPVSMKICGPPLIRMLDMICTRARQLLMKNGIKPPPSSSSSMSKRNFNIEDDPFSRTISFTDNTQFNDTLVGDCCLQACTLKTLLKYC